MYGVAGQQRRAAAASPLSRRPFRGEIQGLRALAVGGVVIFHLWPAALTGGFVGVDVFFVISGFLITQQLAEELLSTGRVALGRFWARRIRRLLPAAFTVLFACLAVVAVVLPRLVWPDNLADLRAAAAYVENWQLAARSVNYLAAENSPSLVQHYWSLSAEEQFYLGWPLLLLAAVAVARRVRGARLRGWLGLALTAAGLTSLAVSVVWTAADPAVAFFATPARAWEFAAGGLASLLPPPAAGAGTGRAAASWAGLGLIVYSMVTVTSRAAFPGLVALVPVAGAVLVVAADLAGSPAWSPGRVTGWRPVQWLGDNSYSIYLWHWPLIITGPWVVHGPLGWPGKLAVLAGSLGLAAVTKRLVEDPVRTGAMWTSRSWPAYALATVGVVALFAVSSTFTVDRHTSGQPTTGAAAAVPVRPAPSSPTRGLVVPPPHQRSCFGAAAMDPANRCPHPYARPRNLDTAFAAADGRTDPCLQNFDAAAPALCTWGRTRAPVRTIAVVGNSHAWRWLPALKVYAQQHRWKIIAAVRSDCLGLITHPVGPHGASVNCLRWSARVQQQLRAVPHLDAVLLPSYTYAQAFTTGTNATPAQTQAADRQILTWWTALAASGTRVLVTQDVPGMRPTPDPECIAQSRPGTDPCAVTRASVVRPNRTATLARQHPQLAGYLPLEQYFCDPAKCHGLIGGVIVYFDSHHLTSTYSRSLAGYLGPAIAAALPHHPPPGRH